MRIFSKVSDVRREIIALKQAGKRIGLVPTMGALHDGHLSLVDALKPHCDVVAMWIFVNPTQFNSPQDYQNYPRNLERDSGLAEKQGVEILFAPEEEEIYPRGLQDYYDSRQVRVRAGDRSLGLCGATRPGHFDGVVHVVNVFFNILEPDIAVFGAKDYQQVKVVTQMVEDLHLPVEILVAPLIREADGLAMSSRNQLLSPERAGAARAIFLGMQHAEQLVQAGETSVSVLVGKVSTELESAGLRPDYIEIVDTETLATLERIESSAQLCVAAFAGEVRLIDNLRLSTSITNQI